MNDDSTHALAIALQVAVPLRIAELRTMPSDAQPQAIAKWATDAAGTLPYRGDQLMYRTRPHRGEGGTADTFNRFARGLAALAFQPGGVTVFGLHWCAEWPCAHHGERPA